MAIARVPSLALQAAIIPIPVHDHAQMKEAKIPSPKRRAPKWLLRSIIFGVPAAVTVVGIMSGAHVAEIVIYSLLSLFSLALVCFYALG